MSFDKAVRIPIKFDDFDYVIAVKMVADDDDHNKSPVPPELGLLVPLKKIDRVGYPFEMVKCSTVLTESTIDNSSEEGKTKFGQDELTLCVPPDKAMTSAFYDELGSGPETFKLIFRECRNIVEDYPELVANVKCKTE